MLNRVIKRTQKKLVQFQRMDHREKSTTFWSVRERQSGLPWCITRTYSHPHSTYEGGCPWITICPILGACPPIKPGGVPTSTLLASRRVRFTRRKIEARGLGADENSVGRFIWQRVNHISRMCRERTLRKWNKQTAWWVNLCSLLLLQYTATLRLCSLHYQVLILINDWQHGEGGRVSFITRKSSSNDTLLKNDIIHTTKSRCCFSAALNILFTRYKLMTFFESQDRASSPPKKRHIQNEI